MRYNQCLLYFLFEPIFNIININIISFSSTSVLFSYHRVVGVIISHDVFSGVMIVLPSQKTTISGINTIFHHLEDFIHFVLHCCKTCITRKATEEDILQAQHITFMT